MEAEGSKPETQFRLWHLFALTAWVALGAAAWRVGFLGALLIFGSISLAGLVAYVVWLERWNAANTRRGQRWSGVIASCVFVAFGVPCSLGSLVMHPPWGLYCATSTYTMPRGNLTYLALAVKNYEAQHGPLPRVIYDADGRPMHSWRALILPLLEESELYGQYRFEEPWDSPHNLKFAEEVPYHYRHMINTSDHKNEVGFLAVFDPDDVNPCVGHFPQGNSTVMLVEAPASGIRWSEPRDLPLDELPAWRAAPSVAGGKYGVTYDMDFQFHTPDRKLGEFIP